MFETTLQNLIQSDYIWAGFFLVASLVIAKIFSIIMKRLTKHAATSSNTLDDNLFPAIRRPIMYLIVIAGIYLAVMNVGALVTHRQIILSTITIVWIVFSALLLFRIGNALIEWYSKSRATGSEAIYTEVMPTVQKVWKTLIGIVVVVMSLGQAGIEVGPLITSLGIAGLAVALAFQDMLANFFAGFYLTTNRPIKKGQFIRLDNGIEGYVEGVDWRNTKLRSAGGQAIIVPNVKVSQAMITNFHEPQKKYSFGVSFIVRPDTDFDMLEEIAISSAKNVIKSTKGADKEHVPLFRVSDATEYGIKVSVIMQAEEYSDQYLMKHELMRDLLRQFKKKGIYLSCPRMDPFPPEAAKRK